MSEEKKNNEINEAQEEQYSLNDDRRVKTLSPGAMVAKRFFRNRVAVTGLVILIFMFVFSFVGGWLMPYSEAQLFYRDDYQNKLFASVTENEELRISEKEPGSFPSLALAQFFMSMMKNEPTFTANGVEYTYEAVGDEFYSFYSDGKLVGAASYDVASSSTAEKLPFDLEYEILKAAASGEDNFSWNGATYLVDDEGGVTSNGQEVAYASRYIVQPLMGDVFLSRQFKEELVEEINKGASQFTFTDPEGQTAEYSIEYKPATKSWSVNQSVKTHVFDAYGRPSKEHLLGTDRNGMDMLTRLMYGGRVSLYIGFIVVAIETIIGVILGGISGYFGKWIDNLIMRIVDIFYCIPSTPLIIILGAAMDAMHVDPQIRMIYLMLILGFLGWPGIARMVRGQILSLREQEFMLATEATGVRVSRRIFKHLIPNVIPQLIVTMTMSLGSTILTEATLSFLGLGVKFPFASWGNIINDVNNTYVLTNYWFIWIPAGFCLLLTVLAFNLVGDGLRDAFDPKMKR